MPGPIVIHAEEGRADHRNIDGDDGDVGLPETIDDAVACLFVDLIFDYQIEFLRQKALSHFHSHFAAQLIVCDDQIDVARFLRGSFQSAPHIDTQRTLLGEIGEADPIMAGGSIGGCKSRD